MTMRSRPLQPEPRLPRPGWSGIGRFPYSMSLKFSSGNSTQADYQAAVIERLFTQFEAARRERNAARKAAIGNFQATDGTGESLRRHGTLTLDHQRGAFYMRRYTLRRHT